MLTIILAAIWIVLWNTKRCPWDADSDSFWYGFAGVVFLVFSILCLSGSIAKHGEGFARLLLIPALHVLAKIL